MPKYNVILNLPGFTVQKVEGYDPILFTIAYRRRVVCPHCNSQSLRKKDTFCREVAHEMLGERRTRLRIKAHKFYCRDCQRYFNQRFPGILKHQRATERLKQQVGRRHSEGICQKALAGLFKIGKATAERWYHHVYTLKDQMILNRHCPRILGIDEHRFSKGVFATTLCDLRKHRVFDVVKGRSQAALHDYLTSLIGRERVQVVCMDLSPSYKSLVQRYFPNAKIVSDRFHVIRQLHHHCLQLYHQIDPKLKYHRGLLAALRTKPERLTPKRQSRRDAYLKQQPAIAAVYHFQQRLYKLLIYKHRNKKQCLELAQKLFSMIDQLKASAFKPMQTLGKTLYRWREEIGRMWRFTKSNGITEGFHRKMKLIQRRAYGFRSFDNYRLRVRVLCS